MGFVVSRVVLGQAFAFPCEYSYFQCSMSIRQSFGKWTIGQLTAAISRNCYQAIIIVKSIVNSFMKILGLSNFISHVLVRSNSVDLNMGTWRI